jgi:phage terminase small subunit
MSLTDKQGAFVSEFLLDHNATQAAIRAGYSSETAQEQASRLLSNVMVRREVDRLIAERSERVQIDADEVVRRLDNLYYESLAKGDLTTAARCLEMLAKATGAFFEHNRQRNPRPLSLAEADALKEALRQRGFITDWGRKNWPAGLPEPGRALPAPPAANG